jgi:hypothetical protein
MTPRFNLYLGRAGQYHAMSEFLVRGWNIAVPEVDVGDDILVLKDSDGILRRVQVKTAQAVIRAQSYSAQFSIPIKQLETSISPELTYVLVIRKGHLWSNLLILRRETLLIEHEQFQVGTVLKDNLILYIAFQETKITCSKRDFSAFDRHFEDFPIIPH